MEYDNGEWIMRGVSENDPQRLKSPEELIRYVNEVGFLPLFKNSVPGFSVEEKTVPYHWWSEDPERDPWIWRGIVAESGKAAYGKFFEGKAGFISPEWFPVFANYRRDGYDFDSRWEDGKANIRLKKIMDHFQSGEEHFSHELKRIAGFGKDGEKNFEGCVTELQMETYLVIRAFRSKLNKKGEPYGWPITVYAAPESLWGGAVFEEIYKEDPQRSFERLSAHLEKICPGIGKAQIRKILR